MKLFANSHLERSKTELEVCAACKGTGCWDGVYRALGWDGKLTCGVCGGRGWCKPELNKKEPEA